MTRFRGAAWSCCRSPGTARISTNRTGSQPRPGNSAPRSGAGEPDHPSSITARGARMATVNPNSLGLGITQDHIDLAESVAGFCARHLTPEAARSAVEEIDDSGAERLPECWPQISEQGLLGLHVPQEFGGSGAGLLEMAVALEALGRHLVPGAFTATVLASAILTADDGKAAVELLPGLVDGSRRGAVVLDARFRGTRDESGAVRVSGTGAAVGAANAEVIIVPVDLGEGTTWVAVDTADLQLRRTSSIDVTRSTAVVTADQIVVPATRVLDTLADSAVGIIAAAVLGAEAVGVASWCVAAAADYAKVRVQFGRPIGQFQGVKHRCAAAAIALEQARAAVWDAARAFDSADTAADYAAAVARLIAPDAAVSTARDAMQVLGGIGYTWEHDAHLYYRRALALRAVLGRSRDAAQAIAELAVQGKTREVRYELPTGAQTYRRQVRADLAAIAQLDDKEQLRRLGDDGWVMPFLAAPYGRDAGPIEQVVIAEEFQHAGLTPPELGLATWLMPSIAAHGTDEQKTDLLAPTLRSEVVWCQMFSEPDAGSDLAALRTEATKVDGGWLVNGQKIWTSLGFIAEWGVLLARTNPDAPKHRGITYFVVDMQTDGITVRPLREASGGTLFS